MASFTAYNMAWAMLIHRKKREIKDLFTNYMKDMLSLPFFGDYFVAMFDATIAAIEGDMWTFRRAVDEGPLLGLANDMVMILPNFVLAGKHMMGGVRYQSGPHKGERKWKNEIVVAVDNLVDVFATLNGLPYYGTKDIARSIKAQVTGGEQPTKNRRYDE
jgi:hypothetical protein